MAYLIAHWRGKLSLKLSLWVNMLGLLVLVSGIELYLLSRVEIDPAHLISVSLVSLFITRALIYPWQLVGLFRAIDRDFMAHRNTLKTWGLQAFALLTVVFTLVYGLEVIQNTLFRKQQLEVYARPPAVIGYTLEIDEGEQQLHIKGALDIGITKAVREVLVKHPALSSVVLQSPGGHVYQGRGLAKLFSEHQLDTYVFKECSSACATAFTGGRNRYLGAEAQLGFHQYVLEPGSGGFRVIFYDPRLEQKRDLELYKSRGVEPEFLHRMFDLPAAGMWFPDHVTLLDANVIDAVIVSKEYTK